MERSSLKLSGSTTIDCPTVQPSGNTTTNMEPVPLGRVRHSTRRKGKKDAITA
jgi:hypothetical protein